MDHSPLGALSPELRNRIYELALHERRPVSISKNFWAEAALLRTCKQVRQEARLLFYSINDFIFVTDLVNKDDYRCLRHWLKRGPKQKLGLIKSLIINVEVPGGDIPTYCEGCGDVSRLPKRKVGPYLHKQSFGNRDVAQVVRVWVNGFRDEQFWGVYPDVSEFEDMEGVDLTLIVGAVALGLQIYTGSDLNLCAYDFDGALIEVEDEVRSVARRRNA